MVSKTGGVWVMTGTTRDEGLKQRLEEELEDPDTREADLVTEAVKEHLDYNND